MMSELEAMAMADTIARCKKLEALVELLLDKTMYGVELRQEPPHRGFRKRLKELVPERVAHLRPMDFEE